MDNTTHELVMQVVREASGGIQAPKQTDRVYKEECMFSFDTPLSPGGLYVSLTTWQAFGRDYVELDHKNTGNHLYLHVKAWKVPSPKDTDSNITAPDRLAIGGEGGFQVDDSGFTTQTEHTLVVYPDTRISLPNSELPLIVNTTLEAILAHQGTNLQDETASWEEDRQESVHAPDLVQLQEGMGVFGRQIPSDPSKWKCDETGVTENLWLNLSTGFIGSGRQNWDGSGGNGAAVRHYEATGKQFPLAVKLGTITPHGADVFSYAENDMVTDSKLAEHLKHWGINMMDLQQTEKTMAELQIHLNMSYEFDKITECGSQLQPLSGPGYVGLRNLGNSCYMNSILQILWTIPQVRQAYLDQASQIFQTAPADPAMDFNTQMAKVGRALCNAQTGGPASVRQTDPATDLQGSADEDILAVKPQSFKTLVGRGHAEFSSGRQQDASEYFQYLLEAISKSERVSKDRLPGLGEKSVASAFEFAIETRIQCHQTGKVSYKRDAETNVLSLSIPMNAAVNKDDVLEYEERETKRLKLKENSADAYISAHGSANGVVTTNVQEDKVLPRVPLNICLEKWRADEEMGDYYSAALGGKTTATKHNRLANFPQRLMVQLNRFYLASDWTAKKLEVLIDVPEKLDLEALRGKGLQPGEEAQPQDTKAPSKGPPAETLRPDPSIVEALKQMGFSENGSKRAAVATKNGGTEAAMEWVLGHMEDADFNEPMAAESSPGASAEPGYTANPESVMMLASMGFTDRQATAALKACQGSLERAADWLFSRTADLDAAVEEQLAPMATKDTPTESVAKTLDDGPGRYRLVGFVSHMGANTACGHYVCHLFKDGKWVIFNDEKVAVSEKPPIELGYMYLYQREDAS